MRIFSGLKKNSKGQGLVEFGLILPLLLVLVFGIIQYGIIFNGMITVTSAAKEGARIASVGGTAGDVETRVENTLRASFLVAFDLKNDPDVKIVVTPSLDPDERTYGDPLVVEVESYVPILVPMVMTNTTYTIRGRSQVRIEGKP